MCTATRTCWQYADEHILQSSVYGSEATHPSLLNRQPWPEVVLNHWGTQKISKQAIGNSSSAYWSAQNTLCPKYSNSQRYDVYKHTMLTVRFCLSSPQQQGRLPFPACACFCCTRLALPVLFHTELRHLPRLEPLPQLSHLLSGSVRQGSEGSVKSRHHGRGCKRLLHTQVTRRVGKVVSLPCSCI